VISFLKALFRGGNTRSEEPKERLFGAPTRLRNKTYSAETGQVYQYVYQGYKPGADARSRKFVFAVRLASGPHELHVLVSEEAITDCERSLGRSLMEQEKYAIAKLALFQGFDSEAAQLPGTLAPTGSDMLEFLTKLGRT
jgi:hypothetical protein